MRYLSITLYAADAWNNDFITDIERLNEYHKTAEGKIELGIFASGIYPAILHYPHDVLPPYHMFDVNVLHCLEDSCKIEIIEKNGHKQYALLTDGALIEPRMTELHMTDAIAKVLIQYHKDI